MDKNTWMQRAGVTPGKMVLVAVLAVVLVGAIVLQLVGASTESEPLRPRTSKKRLAAAGSAARTGDPATAPKAADQKAAVPGKPWPRIPLDEILDHDPLALPPWLAPPPPAAVEPAQSSASEEDAQRERLLVWERLCGQGVALVLITPDGPVATIGDRRVRVGDVIDGFRVEKIDGRGLVLADLNE